MYCTSKLSTAKLSNNIPKQLVCQLRTQAQPTFYHQPALTLPSSILPPEYQPNEAAYYNNRSAAYLMLLKFTDALTDVETAIRLDGNNAKVIMGHQHQIC
jgi:hypothetical protein